jgi:hypothetical protein
MHAATLMPAATEELESRQTSIRVFRSVDEIEAVRDIWTAWQHHPNSDIDFYLMIHHSRLNSLWPYIVLLYRDSSPEAMLVGRIEDSSIEIKLGYARLLAPKVRILNIVYGGALGNLSVENSEALLGEINSALTRGEADVAILRYLGTDCSLFQVAAKAPRILQRDHCLEPQVHRSMTLPDGIEALRSRFSAKVRKNHRWQANKLLQDHSGNVRIRCFRERSELDELFHDAEQIACKTYQRGLGVGFDDNQLMRERLQFEAGRGGLRAYILYVADRPAAFWIGTVYKQTFFSSFMGYEPSLARYSPGTFLLLKVIEGFCTGDSGREVQLIDFGLGDAAYKNLLGDSQWTEASVHLFAPSFRSLGLNALRTPLILLDGMVKSMLKKVEFLARAKHWWRQRVAQRGTAALDSK